MRFRLLLPKPSFRQRKRGGRSIKTKYNEVEEEEEEEKKVEEEGRERREEKTKWGRGTMRSETGENYSPYAPDLLRCKI